MGCNRRNELKKRICIFSFYDKDGIVDDYVSYLLKELEACISRLIIVVNGSVNEAGLKSFQQFTREIHIRENKGYDAGAYKYVLFNCLSPEELQQYDELIFCNDTFFGPLISMQNIFGEMESHHCDVWGMSGFFGIIFDHIQSYFLVFRSKILKQRLLHKYFANCIDELTNDINVVYCQFEIGLFDYLIKKCNMKYDIYAKESRFDVYYSSFIYLSRYQLPIIKKKAFLHMEEALENVLCTLGYVMNDTDYDVNLILKSIKRIYGIEIEAEKISSSKEYELSQAVRIPLPLVNERQIEEFIGENEFYIYGTGAYAGRTYWHFARNKTNLKGFIVSDGQTVTKSQWFEYPIYHFSDIKDICAHKVLLGVNKENAEQIIKRFADKTNVLRIF